MRAYRLNVYDDRTLEMVRARARARESERGGERRARALPSPSRARCRAPSPPPPPSPAAARALSSRPRFTRVFRARAPRRAQINEATKQNFLKRIHYPSLSPAQRALLHDKVPGSGPGAGAAHRPNLAYELVELHVCARAQEFSGNMLTPYAHAVCYERDGVLAGSASATGVDVRRQCRDLYSRDEVSIKASRAGRAWF